MGYRSDVAYAIAFKDRDALNAFITLLRMDGSWNDAMKEALSECRILTIPDRGEYNHGYVALYLRGDSWKWYSGYPVVDAHEAIYAKGVATNHSCRFIRIGEEDDDTEIRTNHSEEDDIDLWELLDLNRSIDSPPADDGEPAFNQPEEEQNG